MGGSHSHHRIQVRWTDAVLCIGLLIFTVYEWREMCTAGEQCFSVGWF